MSNEPVVDAVDEPIEGDVVSYIDRESIEVKSAVFKTYSGHELVGIGGQSVVLCGQDYHVIEIDRDFIDRLIVLERQKIVLVVTASNISR